MIGDLPTAMVFDRMQSFHQPWMARMHARHWRVYNATGSVNVEMIGQCDVIYCNWCDHIAVQLSQKRWNGRLAVMIRSYEAYAGFPGQVNWGNVDLLLFVSPHIRDYCRLMYQLPPDLPVHIVPDCVDVDKFPLKADMSAGNRVACVGRLGAPKNIPFLVTAAYEFPDYHFAFKGPFEDKRLEAFLAYHQSKVDNISVEGPSGGDGSAWHSGEGVNEFLEQCHYIASPSFHEGTHMALLEGMSKGLVPLIQGRPGAVFPVVYHSMTDFAALLKDGAPSAVYRSYIQKHRSLPIQAAAIDEALDALEPSPIITPPNGRLN